MVGGGPGFVGKAEGGTGGFGVLGVNLAVISTASRWVSESSYRVDAQEQATRLHGIGRFRSGFDLFDQNPGTTMGNGSAASSPASVST